MRNCFVPGCDQDHKRRNLPQKRPMFVAPKDKNLFLRWAEVLPKTRPLKLGDRICHMHFQPHEIQKSFKHIIDGQLYQLERDRARLNANAVPSRNLPNIEDLIVHRTRLHQRKPPTQSENISLAMEEEHTDFDEINAQQEELLTKPQLVNVSYCQPQEEEVVSTDLQPNTTQTKKTLETNDNYLNDVFSNLFDDIFEVELPNTLWGIHRCPQRSIIFFTYMDAERMCATKMLTVDNSGTIKVFLASRLMSTHSFNDDVQPTETLSVMLAQLDEVRICPGIDASEECEVEIRNVAAVLDDEQVVELQQLCSNCLTNAGIEVEIIQSTD